MSFYNPVDASYHGLLQRVLDEGADTADRTGVGTRSIFHATLEFDLLGHAMPLITTKSLHTRSVVHELLWFISGDTNVKYLQDNGVRIWNEWADENGDLGPVYGRQFRAFPGPDGSSADQIQEFIHRLKEDPSSRRHIMTTWNPAELPAMRLPPCHGLVIQGYVSQTGGAQHLDLAMYQRSCDLFLGVPFNIASYALLAHLVAHEAGMQARRLVWIGGDVHIYRNHFDQVAEQLSRSSHPNTARVVLNPSVKRVVDFQYDDIVIENYRSHTAIKAPVAV